MRGYPALTIVVASLFWSTLAYARCETIFMSLDDSGEPSMQYNETFNRDSMRYMIRAMLPTSDLLAELSPQRWRIECSNLAEPLAAELRAMADTRKSLDVQFRAVRGVFEAHYLTTVETRKQDHIIGPSLNDLTSVTNFKEWPSRIVPLSPVKNRTRLIYRSPDGFQPVMSISQTLESTIGDRYAAVLETEVAMLSNERQDWSFYAYDKDGLLKNYSTFPGGRRIAPRVCIGCHYNPLTHRMDRLLER